jgi:SAM-dependent methyltransferase
MCGSEKPHKVLGIRLNKHQGFRPSRITGLTTTICKCRTCGLIFSNPMPVPENPQDHYNINPEDYWTKEYLQVEESVCSGMIEKFKLLIKKENDLKFLDIGAGFGIHMKAMQNAGFDAYGIEPSKTFCDFAISKNHIPEEKIINAGIENADFKENFFDFIYFGAVLEHLYKPSEALNTAIKWLKPGGLIYINVPSTKWLIAKMVNFQYKIRLRNYVCNISPMHAPFHLYEFSLKSFNLNAKINNYNIVYHDYSVCETFLPKVFDKVMKKIMHTTNTGMELNIWLKKI